ncbi:hypothetical protein B0H66DRAFT_567933 [Apodospora peruviana]|uniref:Uncharacterized protein n=1 Tax=Apodospora peruviana TaxID=516989 RepID=A0AAE0M0A4_9PEZI|nr:hypothetical protein B0H66DRAFT_567933 [Apodospora peruviana]
MSVLPPFFVALLINSPSDNARSALFSLPNDARVTDKTTHIFMPVPNFPASHDGSSSSSGPYYWSLLIISVHDKIALHYDLRRENANDHYPPPPAWGEESAARIAARKMAKTLSDDSSSPMSLAFVKVNSEIVGDVGPDCGLGVCLLMKRQLELLVRNQKRRKREMGLTDVVFDEWRMLLQVLGSVDEGALWGLEDGVEDSSSVQQHLYDALVAIGRPDVVELPRRVYLLATEAVLDRRDALKGLSRAYDRLRLRCHGLV